MTSPLPADPVQAVRAFCAAADTRDAENLERLLHPEFRVVFTAKGSTSAAILPRSAWFGMLREGKLGGVPRDTVILNATSEAGLAVVRATMQGASGRFESSFTVVREPEGYRIVQDAVMFTAPST